MTILDSNATTLIGAFVLLWLGTGPVRGFAVTLILGILTSIFTAIVVTRVFVDVALDTPTGSTVDPASRGSAAEDAGDRRGHRRRRGGVGAWTRRSI